MSLFQVDFYSKELARITNFNMIFPNDVLPCMIKDNKCYQRKMKTLVLLHGYSGNSKDWLFGSNIQELAVKYNLAVVMPSGGNNFYLDKKGSGESYCEYVGKELVEYVRKTFGIADKKENTFIGGLSMGGFGALHTGLEYHETFGKIIALSSALIIHDIEHKKEDFDDGTANYYYYSSVFGNLDKLDNSPNNPEYLVRLLNKNGEAIPPIYMACGTEDFLIEQNRAFHQFLINGNANVNYTEFPGIHDWAFWNKCLEPSIKWLLE